MRNHGTKAILLDKEMFKFKQWLTFFALCFAFIPTSILADISLPKTSTQLGCEKALQPKSEEQRIDLTENDHHIYVEAIGPSGKALRLTKAQYRERTLNEDIDPDSVLILEDIDLEIDMPFVSGVILSQPLSIEGTHIQVLCEKMNIPLIYSKNAYSKFNGIDNDLYATLRTIDQAHLDLTNRSHSNRNLKSVLPKRYDRHLSDWVVSHGTNKPREIVGDKFFPLARLTRDGFTGSPEIYTYTASVYETFINTYAYKGETLRKIIQLETRDLQHKTPQATKSALARIRQAFREVQLSTGYTDIFAKLSNDTPIEGPLSIRSNNDVEDLIGAGLYASAKADSRKPRDLETAIRKVYESMFTYRAYSIRQAWGLKEENLSMPILVHRYIGHERYNGVGKIQLNQDDEPEMQLTLVVGNQTKATNPNAQAKSLNITLSLDENSQIVVEGDKIDERLTRSVKKFYSSLESHTQRHLKMMTHSPEFLEIEYVVIENKKPGELEFQLLQYKHRYSQELVFAIVTGQLRREALDEELEVADFEGKMEFYDIATALKTKPLSELSFNEIQLPRQTVRYALVLYQGRPQIITWNHSFHSEIKNKLSRSFPQVEWFHGGYIRLYNSGQKLAFERAMMESSTEVFLSLFRLHKTKRLFLKAIKNTMSEKMDFYASFSENPVPILFNMKTQQWTFSPRKF